MLNTISNLSFQFLLGYFLYYLSTILHEFFHRKWAKAYGINILSKSEAVKQDKISKNLPYVFGIQWKPAGAYIHVNKQDLKKLEFQKLKMFFLAGIKSDIIFLAILSFISIIIQLFTLQSFIDVKIIVIAIILIVGKTYENIFDPCNEGSDVTKLYSFRKNR